MNPEYKKIRASYLFDPAEQERIVEASKLIEQCLYLEEKIKRLAKNARDPKEKEKLTDLRFKVGGIAAARMGLTLDYDPAFLSLLEEFCETARHRTRVLGNANTRIRSYNRDAPFYSLEQLPLIEGSLFEDGPAALVAAYERAKAFLDEKIAAGAPDVYGGQVPPQALVRENEMIDIDAEGHVFKVKPEQESEPGEPSDRLGKAVLKMFMKMSLEDKEKILQQARKMAAKREAEQRSREAGNE